MLGNHLDECDKAREVPSAKAQKWAEEHGVKYFEVSAKTGEGLQRAMESLVEAITLFKKWYDYTYHPISMVIIRKVYRFLICDFFAGLLEDGDHSRELNPFISALRQTMFDLSKLKERSWGQRNRGSKTGALYRKGPSRRRLGVPYASDNHWYREECPGEPCLGRFLEP